jgi:hypothetical protein
MSGPGSRQRSAGVTKLGDAADFNVRNQLGDFCTP